MNDREYRRYQMFGRVITFTHDQAADFAADARAMTCSARLTKVISDLDNAKASQAGGSRTAKEVLIDALRLDVQNVTRTARAIEQDEPGFAAFFRPPEGPGQGALLTATDAILSHLLVQPTDTDAVKAAKNARAAKFIACELSVDFVKDLATDRVAISAAQETAESGDNDGVESTAAIGRLIRDGMKEVNYLDAIMHNKYARVPEKLRAWQSASHIERAPHREKHPGNSTALPGTPDSQAA